jgi:hypothetical protein
MCFCAPAQQRLHYAAVANALYPLVGSNYGHVRMSAQYVYHRIVLVCAPHILRNHPSTNFSLEEALERLEISEDGSTETGIATPIARLVREHPLKTPPQTSPDTRHLSPDAKVAPILDQQNRSQRATNPAKKKADRAALRQHREAVQKEQALLLAEQNERDVADGRSGGVERKRKPIVAMMPANRYDPKKTQAVSLDHANDSCLASMFYYLDSQLYVAC